MWWPETNVQCEFADLARLADSKLQGTPCLCLPRAGFKGRLNLGPHVSP